MDAALTRRALAIFEEALESDDANRDAFLNTACGEDHALHAEVTRLLKADAMAERAMPTGGLQPRDEPMPSRIGRYRIVERIGQGGMGDVFVGARDDGLFEHAVAIKRVRPTLFAETARVLFDRERRALAALSHRHIAQLYDGGVDDSGAPYFIMELVRGVAIDDYVHTRDLPPRHIVEMIIAICEAVQHAHQNLIVHADLKPANILVNDAGDPKVVDFGVARLLGEASDAGLYPQTPGYASPQREAGAMPTPADDVFALGAILRALLTGESPRSAVPTLSASQAIERSSAFADRPPEWRNARARAVQGDLDLIITRACAPKAEDRYPAVVALASDLRAWLDFRPISLRAGDRLYVAQQFVRRRRWRVIGGVAAALGLVIALTVTSILYAQADSARRDAEARFTEVRSLAKYVLYDLYDRLERMPKTLLLRRDAARVAQGYLDALAETPSAPPDVLQEAAEGLVRISDLQAGRSRANLGEVDAALDNLARAEAIAARLQQLNGSDPGVAALRASVAIRHAALAMNSRQDFDTAARLLDQANVEIGNVPAEKRQRALLTIQHELESAILGNWKGTYADSVIRAQRALDVASSLSPDPADARDLHYLKARALDAKAEAIYYGQGAAQSEAAYRQLVDLTARYAQDNPEDMLGIRIAIEARWALGVTLLGIDRARDGLAELDAASALLPVLLNFQPDDDGARRTQHVVLSARAQALAMAGRFREGVNLLREQVEISEDLVAKSNNLPANVRSQAVTLAMLADLYDDNGLYRDSCPIYVKSEAIFTDLDKRGELSQLDRDSSLTMIRERQAKHCK
jgi:eukaryotic-like serine/threonine-protein kinase